MFPGTGCLLSRVSSLTLGLMGLDELHLRVLAMSSDNKTERGNAQKGLLRCCSGILDPDLLQC